MNSSTEKHEIMPIFVFLTFKIHLIAIIKHPKHPLSKYSKNTLLKGMVKKQSTNPQLEENQYYYSEDPI